MAQAVRIGNKSYAVGLSWGPLDPEKSLRPQALEKSKQSQNGLYVIYGVIEPHVGHCDAANGVKAGMPVLAPMVAEIWPANTLIAETLGPDIAVGFQIMNGLIYDDVAGSPDEIRNWFDGLVGEHKWDHASSPWGTENYRKGAFEEVLRDRKMKAPRLRSVHEGRGAAIKAGVLALVALSAFLSVSKVVQHRRELAARLALLSRHVVRTVVPPALIVPAGPFVRACRTALDRIPAAPAGWKAQTVSCLPDRVRIVWKREEGGGSGTIRDLESALGEKVHISDSGSVRSDLPLSVPSIRIPVDRLPDRAEGKKDLLSLLERYALRSVFSEGLSLPGGSGGAESGSNFSIDLPDLPEGRLLADLEAIYGLSVDALDWTGQSRWILKGELKHAPLPAFHRNRNGAPGPRSSRPPGRGANTAGPDGLGRPGALYGGIPGGSGPRGSAPDPHRDGKRGPGGSIPPVRFP